MGVVDVVIRNTLRGSAGDEPRGDRCESNICSRARARRRQDVRGFHFCTGVIENGLLLGPRLKPIFGDLRRT